MENNNLIVVDKKKRGRPKKNNISFNIVEQPKEIEPVEDIKEVEPEDEYEPPVFDDDFLNELSHKNFMKHRDDINLQEIEKVEMAKVEKELEKQMKIQMKEDERRSKR